MIPGVPGEVWVSARKEDLITRYSLSQSGGAGDSRVTAWKEYWSEAE